MDDVKVCETLDPSSRSYQQAVALLAVQASRTSRPERRHWWRAPLAAGVEVLFRPINAAGVGYVRIRTRNFGPGGICFLHGRDLPCGQEGELIFADRATHQGFRTVGRVLRSRHVVANVHEVAIRFNEPMPDTRAAGFADSGAIEQPRGSGATRYETMTA